MTGLRAAVTLQARGSRHDVRTPRRCLGTLGDSWEGTLAELRPPDGEGLAVRGRRWRGPPWEQEPEVVERDS